MGGLDNSFGHIIFSHSSLILDRKAGHFSQEWLSLFVIYSNLLQEIFTLNNRLILFFLLSSMNYCVATSWSDSFPFQFLVYASCIVFIKFSQRTFQNLKNHKFHLKYLKIFHMSIKFLYFAL